MKWIIGVLVIFCIVLLIRQKKLTAAHGKLQQLNEQSASLQAETQKLSQSVQQKLDENVKLTKERERLENQIESSKQFHKMQIDHSNEVIDQLKRKQNDIEQIIQNNVDKQKLILDERLRLERAHTIKEYQDDLLSTQNDLLESARMETRAQIDDMTAQVIALQNELTEFQEKRNAINQEILRQRELAEKQDFSRICLTDEEKDDIRYLLSIIPNIKHKDILYKLIWSEYIQKPFQRMTTNVLGGKDIKNVIYKITNLSTGEIYIGKTKQEVSKRWTDHIKTSLMIGTSTPKKVHKALFNNWDNFSFEVLEQVSDDVDLGARESYYIKFYESNIYGYNSVQ